MKIGQDIYARRGYSANSQNAFIVIGRPTVDGEKWVTIATLGGGDTQSFPPGAFESLYWKVEG